MIKELINEDSVEINAEVKNWREAVQKSGLILEKCGKVEHRYTEAMVENVEHAGPYIVIAPGIAMPHARSEQGVKEIGISLLLLKTPVNFGNPENDPVKIVVALSAKDSSSHLDTLAELMELLGDKTFVSMADKPLAKQDLINYIHHKKFSRSFEI
ncbi:Phosphoenolpyruvate-dependent sugar phosphotransferase system, EIIA 2 [Caprobacter fermentans]|uniref:PTS sugar transporter subunit IIA n=1 Tax=Caproicibacter fermentans TaxID=2576756 RepID=A0A6N8HWE0_9FIRM|nr:PTS sugar transporter subunit IIA [Caproicibacter fermentans]MVB09713.1 Phosphoenolpyruvate-dependent sugar phosphotransferase system, EIIA 2 [Caproicibacter fermentans]OCN03203.1 PTS maltose transporter subunit IIBC [Clostridium sp. W14A]QNK42401.1 PTS sugar transporter subunit IIA [Caproicibacter fermentans]